MPLKILPFYQSEVRTNQVAFSACVSSLPSFPSLTRFSEQPAVLTIALSWELLACVMPRMLVVCITSTEKLGSQLAIRDPETERQHRCRDLNCAPPKTMPGKCERIHFSPGTYGIQYELQVIRDPWNFKCGFYSHSSPHCWEAEC